MRIASIWLEITGALESLSRFKQRRTDIYHDEDVDPISRATSIGRFSAIPPSTSAARRGRPVRTRPGPTCWHARARQVTGVHDDGITGLEIGRVTARKGVGSSSKLVTRATGQSQSPQGLGELLSLYQPLGQLDVAAPHTEGELHQEIRILELTPESEILPRWPVPEGILPVERVP